MAELTQRMIDAGATFIDDNGIPMRADGTPALVENQPKVEVPSNSNGVIEQIQRQLYAGQTAQTQGEPAPDTHDVGGFPFPDDPLTYGFGPFYGASSEKLNKEPLNPGVWNSAMGTEKPEGAMDWDEPDSWKKFYTPNDTSTGGGFFFADDLFAEGKTPFAFGGESLHVGGLSTNNYRLLPAGYNSPRYIMRNGQIIDKGDTELFGPAVQDGSFGQNFGGPRWNFGAGTVMNTPVGYSAGSLQSHGWPGQLGSWLTDVYWTG